VKVFHKNLLDSLTSTGNVEDDLRSDDLIRQKKKKKSDLESSDLRSDDYAVHAPGVATYGTCSRLSTLTTTLLTLTVFPLDLDRWLVVFDDSVHHSVYEGFEVPTKMSISYT
jgi:hypothetical protein